MRIRCQQRGLMWNDLHEILMTPPKQYTQNSLTSFYSLMIINKFDT